MDLFVRASNDVAITLYEKLGYVIYRTVLKYYSASGDTDAEDAYGTVGGTLPWPLPTGNNPSKMGPQICARPCLETPTKGPWCR